MRIAYLDCFAGISGDMFLGALLDAGVPLAVLEEAVQALPIKASLRIEKVDRSGIFSTKVHVLESGVSAEAAPRQEDHTHEHRGQPAHEHGKKPAHGGEPGLTQEQSHPVSAEAHSHAHAQTPVHADAPEEPHTHAHEHLVHAHPHLHSPQQAPTHEAHTGHVPTPEDPHEHLDGHEHPHSHPHVHGRSLTQIRALIEEAGLAQPVKDFALGAFELLGSAEAKIHNVALEQIHFHEVGSVDAIVDIVAAAAGIAYLNRQGPLDWFCSTINVGGGMVECAHGTFPVPAPATADLLRGMPTYSAHVQKELVTPTGAALLKALSPQFGAQPAMRVHSIGYGAGTRNSQRFPNVLRLSLGHAEPAPKPTADQQAHSHGEESVVVLETALDDATPQLLAHVAERALAAGALDVMLTPVVMKKGRPATLITLLCDPPLTEALENLLLRETTTLGIRRRREQRTCLERHHTTVSTAFGEIRVKVGSLRGEELNVMPEYEDCRTAARLHEVPLKQVMQAATSAYALAPTR